MNGNRDEFPYDESQLTCYELSYELPTVESLSEVDNQTCTNVFKSAKFALLLSTSENDNALVPTIRSHLLTFIVSRCEPHDSPAHPSAPAFHQRRSAARVADSTWPPRGWSNALCHQGAHKPWITGTMFLTRYGAYAYINGQVRATRSQQGRQCVRAFENRNER